MHTGQHHLAKSYSPNAAQEFLGHGRGQARKAAERRGSLWSLPMHGVTVMVISWQSAEEEEVRAGAWETWQLPPREKLLQGRGHAIHPSGA